MASFFCLMPRLPPFERIDFVEGGCYTGYPLVFSAD